MHFIATRINKRTTIHHQSNISTDIFVWVMIDDGDNDGNTGGGFNWVVLITPPITKGAGFNPPLVGIPCRVFLHIAGNPIQGGGIWVLPGRTQAICFTQQNLVCELPGVLGNAF